MCAVGATLLTGLPRCARNDVVFCACVACGLRPCRNLRVPLGFIARNEMTKQSSKYNGAPLARHQSLDCHAALAMTGVLESPKQPVASTIYSLCSILYALKNAPNGAFFYIIPGIPPAILGVAGFSSGISDITQPVVRIAPAVDAAA